MADTYIYFIIGYLVFGFILFGGMAVAIIKISRLEKALSQLHLTKE